MPLLIPGIFLDKMKIFAANDESAVHFGRDDSSGEDTAADGDFAGEWAFLVWERQSERTSPKSF